MAGLGIPKGEVNMCPDNPDNQLEQTNEHTTPVRGFRLYHLKTLLWTYLVWAVLDAFFLFWCQGIYNYPLERIPYYWGILHIFPLGLLLPNEISSFGLGLPACAALSVLFLIAGLLINKGWARFLIIVGMSILFLESFFLFVMLY